MAQELVVYTAIELIAFCIIIYLIIRANIYVNTLQREVNELYIYLPVTIRDIKYDLKKFNQSLKKHFETRALDAQEIGALVGKIFSDIILSRFSASPFKKNMALTSILLKLWKMRERIKVTLMQHV